jgi:GT2 family glycosyltransferase
MKKTQNYRDIIRTKKELGYYWTENPVRHLSLRPAAMKRLGVRVVRKGIHEARKVNQIARVIDTAKPYVRRKKSIIPKRAAFQNHKTYEVSIVIPVYNKKAYTLACLSSLTANVGAHVPYEVIVIDNDSTDGTAAALAKIPGLVYKHNKKNMGFVDACNQGAKMARGKYIVFLNNDTLVQKSWLESLLETVQRDGVGIVGSKLVYPNEKLQEAGGIIFNDGSGHNYGRNQLPNDYKYNYVREVDYCSGASIIIRKDFFFEVGGFDRLYAPAYYEDTDLSFATRKAGLKVLYQPKSVVYHVEGGTAGTNLNSGFKRFQAINKAKFEKKWAKELSEQQVPGEAYLGRDRSSRKLALIVDENIPKTDEDSGSVRMFRIIESLSRLGYKVTFFPYNTTYNQKYAQPLQQMGVEVVYGGAHFLDFVREYGHYYDVVILSRPRMASFFLEYCRIFCKNAKLLYDTVDLHYLRLRRQAEYDDDKKKLLVLAQKHEVIEKHLMDEADVTLVVSDVEKDVLEKDGYRVDILSNIHEIDESAYKIGYDERKDLLFVGGYSHPPNIDGIRWFVNDILPGIRKQLPDVKLIVVGSNMPDELRRELASRPGVVVKGFVEDLELKSLLARTRVFVAPLRYGAGVKGKIGQAIEHGTPVVSTSIGVEGMRLTTDSSCQVADNATHFAEKVVELYCNATQWVVIQQNAKQLVIDNFSPEKTVKDLRNILSR